MLQNVTLDLPAGQLIAVAGSSGITGTEARVCICKWGGARACEYASVRGARCLYVCKKMCVCVGEREIVSECKHTLNLEE